MKSPKIALFRQLLFIIFLTVLTPKISISQEIARFKIDIDKSSINTPVSVPLNGLNYNVDSGYLNLYDITDGKSISVDSQIETGHSASMWFVINGEIEESSSREYLIKLEKSSNCNSSSLKIVKDYQDLSILSGSDSILSYRYGVTQPPKGVDPNYKRSGYIHPLRSPDGEILTNVQPKDHYHHYGIWGPWTKTHIEGREVDFWNLAKGLGTVKFDSFSSEIEGAIFTSFKAIQHHIDFGAKGADNVAINETLEVRAWNIDEGVYVVDYTTTINTPLESGILLDAYRYGGGIGFRATDKWHKDNCTVLSSEGRSRLDSDGTSAKWCLVEGESISEKGRSGIIFLSHPSNRMHQEPMRVWPIDANGGRGDMYFQFTPIRHKEWMLNQNRDYTLKYRMVIFDGAINSRVAEMYWNAFAKTPVVEFIRK